MRYKATVEYDGTEYHGWQIQPNARTLQGVIEDALHKLGGEKVRVAAAGRTDAGVHACGQVISFVLAEAKSEWVVQRALNALTPPDISFRTVESVAEGFDPRRAARGRSYVYRIWNERVPSPFWRRYAWHVARRLDVEAMNEAASALIGEHDFTSFRAADCEADNPIRRVDRSTCVRDGSLILYSIDGTAFLKHMVRNIIGTLVEIGLGERASANLAETLAAHDRNRAGATAPPTGLCLTQVRYE